jgi:hypothetical protein
LAYTPSYTKTVGTIITEALRLLNDTDEFYFTHAVEGLRAYNKMLFNLVKETGILRDTADIVLVEDQAVYDWPTEAIRLIRLRCKDSTDATYRVILPVEEREVIFGIGITRYEGSPYEFYREGIGPREIGFIPTPSGITDYGDVECLFVTPPTKATQVTDSVDTGIPKWIHQDMKYGVAIELLSIAPPDFAMHGKRNYLEQKWNFVVKRMKKFCNYESQYSRLMRPG